MSTPAGAFLDVLPAEERELLVASGRRRRYQRGQTLFVEGHRSDQVVVILAGRVKIFTSTEDGHETVLAVRGAGELLGELSAIDGHSHSATATAVEEVDAVVLPVAVFRAHLESHGRTALLLLTIVSGRLRDADRKRTEFGALDAVGRVSSRLIELAATHGEPYADGVRITLPFSQEELAAWTGSSREAVAKALRALRERGLIRTNRREITVLDADGLRHRAT